MAINLVQVRAVVAFNSNSNSLVAPWVDSGHLMQADKVVSSDKDRLIWAQAGDSAKALTDFKEVAVVAHKEATLESTLLQIMTLKFSRSCRLWQLPLTSIATSLC